MLYWNALWRTALSFAVLWAVARLLGRKQISRLTLFDYITGIAIGSVAARVIATQGDWRLPLVSLVAWGVFTFIFEWAGLKGRSLHRILDDEPAILIRHGQVLEGHLRREHTSLQELMSMLRGKGYFEVSEVEYALLEPNGELSVLPRGRVLPVQVMQEGEVIEHGLKEAGRSREWVQAELARQGVQAREVFAAWVSSRGTLLVDRYSRR